MEPETARLKKHREKLRKQKRDAMKNVYGS